MEMSRSLIRGLAKDALMDDKHEDLLERECKLLKSIYNRHFEANSRKNATCLRHIGSVPAAGNLGRGCCFIRVRPEVSGQHKTNQENGCSVLRNSTHTSNR